MYLGEECGTGKHPPQQAPVIVMGQGACIDDGGQREANSVSRGAYRNPRAQSAVVWHPAPDAGVPTSATRAATHEAQVILQLQVQLK